MREEFRLFWLGAKRSVTMIFNVLLAALAAAELFTPYLNVLVGPKAAAMVLLIGAIYNMYLRTKTTMSLKTKALLHESANS
jgi:hypothetical protein